MEILGGFPSGQRGQTVNLLAQPSQVQILHLPLKLKTRSEGLDRKNKRARPSASSFVSGEKLVF
jgi:hypothetical protein